MNIQDLPLAQLLSDHVVFDVFHQAFMDSHTWLDAGALVGSESTIADLYCDGTVPSETLDVIVEKLQSMMTEDNE